MHLRDYLAQQDSKSVSQLRQSMNALGADIQHDAQIRQWLPFDKKKRRFKRQPNPANCWYLERATDGAVDRKSMRPRDYAAIWPELLEAETV